jgi:hypothetical protein
VRAIHQLLLAANKSVPYYVFGHTHIAEQFPLAFGATTPSYLNSGTWTQIIPPDFEAPSSREYFTFIEITRAPGSATPAGRLLFWNDAAGQVEPLPLLRM